LTLSFLMRACCRLVTPTLNLGTTVAPMGLATMAPNQRFERTRWRLRCAAIWVDDLDKVRFASYLVFGSRKEST
ncbi:MAG TPA: hypothetical protein VGJ20_28925, partial [Xanthobacteraceae bacterium]